MALKKKRKSARVYVYLDITLQAEARSDQVGHSAYALDANPTFKSIFTELINSDTYIADNILRYQNVLEYAQ